MTATARRAFLIVGSLVALLLVAALALPAVGRIVQSTNHESHDLPADLTHLALEGAVGDISIRAAGAGEEPGAEVTIRSSLTRPTVRVEVAGDRVEMSETCQGRWWDSCSVSWEIVVPADAEVVVASAVGDITITDVTGALSISSRVGSVTATGIASPTVNARSAVGDITVELVAAPDEVRVTSSTGDITVTVPDDGTGYRVATDTSVGTVTNQVGSDPSQSRLVDLGTSVGDIALRRGN